MSLIIRPFDAQFDYDAVSHLWRHLFGAKSSLPQVGHMAWLDDEPIGLVRTFKYEGLPQFTAVEGGILPDYRRCGYGTDLLTAVLADLPPHSPQELVADVGPWDSPAGHFLRHHGFTLEHEEITYERPATLPLAALSFQPDYRVVTPEKHAGYTFTGVYSTSFKPHRWYQRYNPINLPSHIPGLLILYHKQRAIGFAWTHVGRHGTGQIEPFGIIPDYQGQGHGRVLLHTALHHLYHQEMSNVRIITWAINQPSRRLYERCGFTAVASNHHLSLKL